mgnify:CR=1 FL=1
MAAACKLHIFAACKGQSHMPIGGLDVKARTNPSSAPFMRGFKRLGSSYKRNEKQQPQGFLEWTAKEKLRSERAGVGCWVKERLWKSEEPRDQEKTQERTRRDFWRLMKKKGERLGFGNRKRNQKPEKQARKSCWEASGRKGKLELEKRQKLGEQRGM